VPMTTRWAVTTMNSKPFFIDTNITFEERHSVACWGKGAADNADNEDDYPRFVVVLKCLLHSSK